MTVKPDFYFTYNRCVLFSTTIPAKSLYLWIRNAPVRRPPIEFVVQIVIIVSHPPYRFLSIFFLTIFIHTRAPSWRRPFDCRRRQCEYLVPETNPVLFFFLNRRPRPAAAKLVSIARASFHNAQNLTGPFATKFFFATVLHFGTKLFNGRAPSVGGTFSEFAYNYCPQLCGSTTVLSQHVLLSRAAFRARIFGDATVCVTQRWRRRRR